jgi:hypothetical protein
VSITVYGASDDLIEVDGDISEEFYYAGLGKGGDYGGDLIAFSDGTILRVRIDASGVWRITPVVQGSATTTIDVAPEDDEVDYSDRATVSGAAWVVHGIGWAK